MRKFLIALVLGSSFLGVKQSLYGIDINQFHPIPGSGRILTTDFGYLGPHLEFSGQLLSHYMYHPLKTFALDGVQLTDRVDHRLDLELSLSLALWRHLQIALLFPFTIGQFDNLGANYNNGYYVPDRFILPKGRVDDIHLFLKGIFWENTTKAKASELSGGVGITTDVSFALADDSTSSFPTYSQGTTSAKEYKQNDIPTSGWFPEINARIKAVGHAKYRWLQVAFNLGVIFAGPELASSIQNAPKFSSGVIYGIGAQFNVWETPHSSQISLFTEISGVARAPFDALSQPAEWIVGFKGLFLDEWSPFFGATFGLDQGYGAATFRLFLGCSWTYSAKEKLPPQAPISPVVIVQQTESPLVKVLGSEINIPVKTFSDFDQDHPQAGDLRVLDSIALLLQARPDLKKVRIEGHTDNLGSDKYNLELSWRRAVFVKTYLVSKGIDDSRLVTEGFGFRCPLVPNDTAEHQAQNRRVEFVIVEQEGHPLNTAKCTPSSKQND